MNCGASAMQGWRVSMEVCQILSHMSKKIVLMKMKAFGWQSVPRFLRVPQCLSASNHKKHYQFHDTKIMVSVLLQIASFVNKFHYLPYWIYWFRDLCCNPCQEEGGERRQKSETSIMDLNNFTMFQLVLSKIAVLWYQYCFKLLFKVIFNLDYKTIVFNSLIFYVKLSLIFMKKMYCF